MATVFASRPTGNSNAIVIQNDSRLDFRAGMRITNDGFLHVTNAIDQSHTDARLDSGGNWTRASDRKLKYDVQEIGNLLERVLSLNPVDFFYNEQDRQTMPHKSIGLIAQDVETIFPQLVSGTETKYLDYTGLTPILIGAIKEMKHDYDEKIAHVEMQLEELKRSLNQA
jgi:hypothetical protein